MVACNLAFFHLSGTLPRFRGSLLMWCTRKSQWLLCIWKMASLHWNPQHHLLNSPVQTGKASSSNKHTLFSSTLASGKSGGKALAPQLQCREGCTQEQTPPWSHQVFTELQAEALRVVGMFQQMFSAPGSYPNPPLEARVRLKRTLLSVHVFFHNWMCWRPKLLFLSKHLHDF